MPPSPVVVKAVQLTVHFGDDRESNFWFEVKADKRPNRMTRFDLSGDHNDNDLTELLDKIKIAYNSGPVKLCVAGNRIINDKIVRRRR